MMLAVGASVLGVRPATADLPDPVTGSIGTGARVGPCSDTLGGDETRAAFGLPFSTSRARVPNPVRARTLPVCSAE